MLANCYAVVTLLAVLLSGRHHLANSMRCYQGIQDVVQKDCIDLPSNMCTIIKWTGGSSGPITEYGCMRDKFNPYNLACGQTLQIRNATSPINGVLTGCCDNLCNRPGGVLRCYSNEPGDGTPVATICPQAKSDLCYKLQLTGRASGPRTKYGCAAANGISQCGKTFPMDYFENFIKENGTQSFCCDSLCNSPSNVMMGATTPKNDGSKPFLAIFTSTAIFSSFLLFFL